VGKGYRGVSVETGICQSAVYREITYEGGFKFVGSYNDQYRHNHCRPAHQRPVLPMNNAVRHSSVNIKGSRRVRSTSTLITSARK
jgi:hypothetical protein